MEKLKIVWTRTARDQLKAIYDYYRFVKKTPQGASNLRNEILEHTKSIRFIHQYQKDEIQPEYRRIIVRHYKILYKQIDKRIVILRIFNTYQNPGKQTED